MLTIKKKGQLANQTQEQKITAISRRVTDILARYRKHLIIAASVLAALLVIAGGYSIIRSSDEKKAGPHLAGALEAYGPLDSSTADYGKALELFRDVRKKYSGTMSGAIAQYYIGNCLANLSRTDEALKEYQDFVKSYSGEKFLLGLVYQRMGYVYGMLGKQADAVKAFEQAEAVGGPGVATVELARSYEASGNMPESQKKYKIIMEKLGGTTWSGEAMGKVQVLKPASQPPAGNHGK